MKKCAYCGSEFDGALHECPYCGGRAADHICKNCGAEYDGAACPQCGVRADDEGQRGPRCGARMFKGECSSCGYMADKGKAVAAEAKKAGAAMASWFGTLCLCVVGVIFPFVSIPFIFSRRHGKVIKWFFGGYGLFYIWALTLPQEGGTAATEMSPGLRWSSVALTALALLFALYRLWRESARPSV